jgi:hypothetical protein
MRHVYGFILALVLAAALFAGGGWGVARVIVLHGQHGGTGLISIAGALAVAAAAGTGLLAGLLIAAPGISPLAPGLPGLAALAWSALLAVRASQATRLIPLTGRAIGAGFHVLLTTGMLAVLGAALIVPLFVPSRWRGRADPDEFGPRASTGLLR